MNYSVVLPIIMMANILYFLIKILFRFIKLFNSSTVSNYITILLNKLYTLWVLVDLGSKDPHIYLQRSSVFRGRKKIYIGKFSTIQRYSCIEAIEEYKGELYTPQIKIGENVNIGEYNHITSINSIIIGDGVLTGRRVTISDNNHGAFDSEELNNMPKERKLTSKGPIDIGDNVWIGENACVLSGVKIGKGSIVAANAVVLKDVPPFCLVAGIPAKIIKQCVF